MTDTSGPTREAMEAALKVLRAIFGDSAVLSDNEVRLCALAIDAHTQAIRAENAHLKSVNEKGLAELALLRDRLRLAVEALKKARAFVERTTERENPEHYGNARDALHLVKLEADELLPTLSVDI